MADEIKIEDDYCKWINDENHGVALKLKLSALKGWPDRTVLLYGGVIFFIEFKDPTGEQSPQQIEWQRIIEILGFNYYICDNLLDAKNVTMKEYFAK